MGDEDKQDETEPTPPGHFVSEDHRTQTAHFLDELRKRLHRKQADEEPRLGPPHRR